MDPLAHTLAGANLAATPLGAKGRFASAALVIGANLPDIDGITYLIDRDLALGFRRGWTHGVLALVVLPLVLTAVLALCDRLRPDPARRTNVPWLLLVSTIGVLTHPTLDWLNTYGMRWLMPFRSDWFYGDAVFIMDPWLWLVLGTGWLAGRRPSIATVGGWLFFALYIGRMVARRSPESLVIIAAVAFILLGALLWRGGATDRRRRAFAAAALAIASLYIGGRLVIRAVTEQELRGRLTSEGMVVERMMLSPSPLDPTRWDVVFESGDVYRYGQFTWADRELNLSETSIRVADDAPEYRAAMRDPSVRGFATWVRFPAYEIERVGDEVHVHLLDARRAPRGGSRGGFGSRVVVLRDGDVQQMRTD